MNHSLHRAGARRSTTRFLHLTSRLFHLTVKSCRDAATCNHSSRSYSPRIYIGTEYIVRASIAQARDILRNHSVITPESLLDRLSSLALICAISSWIRANAAEGLRMKYESLRLQYAGLPRERDRSPACRPANRFHVLA